MQKRIHTSVLAVMVFFMLFTGYLPAQDFESGKIAISLNAYGRVRVYAPDFDTIQIDRSSILVATGKTTVFDYHNDADEVDSSRTIVSPGNSDFELYGSFDNSWSELPPDIWQEANIYGWNNSGFSVVKFRVHNMDSESVNVLIGLEFIAQIDGEYGFESSDFITGDEVVTTHVGDASTFTGYKFLSSELTSLRSFDWFDGYSDLDSNYYNWMTYGAIDTSVESGSDGLVSVMTQDAVPLAADAYTDLWIGISVGSDLNTMLANMDTAVMKYDDLIVASINSEPKHLAQTFSLDQNYPNPFNPQTTISFELPEKDLVSLKIYNMIGQEIATLVHQELNAGAHQYSFNAQNLPSGLYFYTLRAGNYRETRKMMLMK